VLIFNLNYIFSRIIYIKVKNLVPFYKKNDYLHKKFKKFFSHEAFYLGEIGE